MDKILVVTLSNLGDVVLTLPVFQSLRQAYPKAQIHAVVSPSARAVLENDIRISRVFLYDKKKKLKEQWKLLTEVRAEHYDLIVDLRRSWIGFLGGARRHNRYSRLRRKRSHRVLYHLRELEALAPIGTSESFLKPRAIKKIENIGGSQGPLVVAAVGSKSDIKKWPAEHYAALLDRMAFDGCQIVLVGDKHDAADAQKVAKLMTSRALDLTGRTGFDELVSVISHAVLVITNDSAPLHIADSLKVPVLAIFGPTDPQKYGPRTAGSQSVSLQLFCSPCETAQCRYGHECMKDLSVDQVYQKAQEILNDRTHGQDLKILVVRLDRIGDVILSLPALQALRDRFPSGRISVLQRSATRSLLEGHPAVDEVISYDYKKGGCHRFPLGYFRLLGEITRRRFDVVFILHPGLRSTLLVFLAGIPYRLGYKDPWSFLLTTAVPDMRHLGLKHESQYAMDILRAFPPEAGPPLQDNVPSRFSLFVSKFEAAEARKLFPGEKVIALHPGSSCPSKRWPLEHFEALGSRILNEFPHQMVIVGGKEETGMGQRLKKVLGQRAVDRTGQLSLKELAALMARCELLISNDSGPVHVAAAVGTRVISIFGRNQAGLSPTRWKPLGAGHTVIQKDVGCVVCLAHDCPIEFECLKAISVDEVLSAVHQTLSHAHFGARLQSS